RERLARGRGLQKPLPADHQDREELEVVGAVEQHALDLAPRAHGAELGRERRDEPERALDLAALRLADAGRAGALHRGRDLLGDERGRGPAAGHDLAPEQIEALDARRALVDAVELLIAQPRLGQVLAGVAVAAVDLKRERV